MIEFPETIENEEQLEELLSRPTAEVVELFKTLEGDIIFLGIAGKIGPSISRMARRACDAAGVSKRLIGVPRFSNKQEKSLIESLSHRNNRRRFTGSGVCGEASKSKKCSFPGRDEIRL